MSIPSLLLLVPLVLASEEITDRSLCPSGSQWYWDIDCYTIIIEQNDLIIEQNKQIIKQNEWLMCAIVSHDGHRHNQPDKDCGERP